MNNQIKTLYVIHHSHTDIGYTDLQERIIAVQAEYISTVISLLKEEKNRDFRWNCETWYCVEQFLKDAPEEEKEEFFRLMREGKIGFSATYLNFNDLLDCSIYEERLREAVTMLKSRGITPKTAMFADINGIAMGQRDAMIENGIEFLFTNIHSHHGMYPLYKNQTPFYWENQEGKRLLVWNGEHYNLGNFLGIKPNRSEHYQAHNAVGGGNDYTGAVEVLHKNLKDYLKQCQENEYPYDFIVSGVSGVFSDNAPPNMEVLEVIEAYNAKHQDLIRLQLVSLQELYEAIAEKVADAPVYRGDMTDWWANGVGSTPYAVKHYKEARKKYHLARRLDQEAASKYPDLVKRAQDNLLLYAEHTWGHSSSIGDPYDTMVLNLDIRKTSYASGAHESASLMLDHIAKDQGDLMRYYNTSGEILVKNPSSYCGKVPIEFYIESCIMKNVRVTDKKTGAQIPSQLSSHPRGALISFTDELPSFGHKEYCYEELPEIVTLPNTGRAYIGAERIKDIINDYEPTECLLPYEYENEWFYLSYAPYEGIRSFRNKKTGEDLLCSGQTAFFTPVYENTKVETQFAASGHQPGMERRRMGRNIRGKHAISTEGRLMEIKCLERGEVFTLLELVYELPGTLHCSVILKIFEAIPQIDFKLRIAKTLSEDIESVYMPLTLPCESLWLKKGKEAFRPGIDQLPGTCMEYYMSDDGLVYRSGTGSILLETCDTPLVTMGELKHHAVQLCDNQPEYNRRQVYSWVMNNTWETNFKLDLSGFGEFLYSMKLSGQTEQEACFEELEERSYKPYVYIMK